MPKSGNVRVGLQTLSEGVALNGTVPRRNSSAMPSSVFHHHNQQQQQHDFCRPSSAHKQLSAQSHHHQMGTTLGNMCRNACHLNTIAEGKCSDGFKMFNESVALCPLLQRKTNTFENFAKHHQTEGNLATSLICTLVVVSWANVKNSRRRRSVMKDFELRLCILRALNCLFEIVIISQFGAADDDQRSEGIEYCFQKMLVQPCVRQKKVPAIANPRSFLGNRTLNQAKATNVEHFGIHCVEANFAAAITQFAINISASLYGLSCEQFSTKRDLDELPDNYLEMAPIWRREECEQVPILRKCNKASEFVACFESKKKELIFNGQIAALCRRHLGNSRFAAGFRIRHCSRRVPQQRLIIIDSILEFSFAIKKFIITRHLPITNEAISNGQEKTPIFFIEFGNGVQQSAVRNESGGKDLSSDTDKKDTVGAILSSIVDGHAKGCLSKSLHFIPPSDAHTRVFLQMANIGFSARINRDKNIKAYANNPNITSPSSCDILGDDCETTRDLLWKSEELLECCSPSKKANPCTCSPPPLVPLIPMERKRRMGDPLVASDILHTKKDAQEMFEYYEKVCSQCYASLERVNRRKRQAMPYLQRWTKFPIAIRFSDSLKNKPQEYVEAVRNGHQLITNNSCVKFTTDLSNNPEEGINIIDNGATQSELGKQGGWQDLSLNQKGVGTVSHELLHAIGIRHEHQRSDAYKFIRFKKGKKDNQWKTNFEPQKTDNFGFPYDFGSVMHYPAHSTETDVRGMITINRFYEKTTGQREKPSFKDLALINYIYCKEKCQKFKNICLNGGYLNPKKCWQCNCPDGFGGLHCELVKYDANCEDLANFSFELEADSHTRVLKPKLRCKGPAPCSCHWRIKPKNGRLSIKMIRLDAASLQCRKPCGSFRIEIKFRNDKRSRGAWICCADDIAKQETKNWIEADGPAGEEIIISAYIGTMHPTDLFELTYETGGGKLIPSDNCPEGMNWSLKRNPLTLLCPDPVTGEKFACRCLDGQQNCVPIGVSNGTLDCQVLILNGQYREIRGELAPKQFEFECLKRQGDNVPFWAYSTDKGEDPIHIDELQCLKYLDIGLDMPPSETLIDYLLMKRLHYNRHLGP